MMQAQSLALNPQNLDSLRYQAKQDGGKSAKAAAQQFESYFLQMMLRSMRQTVSQNGMFDNQQTRMFTEMFDQQIAQNIAQSKGIGLADMLVKQISAAQSLAKPAVTASAVSSATAAPAKQTAPAVNSDVTSAASMDTRLGPDNFVEKLLPAAKVAGEQLGIAPHLLLAQAALETGWGQHQVNTQGHGSRNLFNIKANAAWQGDQVSSATTEYANGAAQKTTAAFRAYESYEQSFNDYVNLIKNNPRYAQVMGQGDNADGFAHALQRGGYATDPAYAAKLRRVADSVAQQVDTLG